MPTAKNNTVQSFGPTDSHPEIMHEHIWHNLFQLGSLILFGSWAKSNRRYLENCYFALTGEVKKSQYASGGDLNFKCLYRRFYTRKYTERIVNRCGWQLNLGIEIAFAGVIYIC